MHNCVGVTAMYDINRESIDGRSIDFYFKHFIETIKINIPIVIYLDKKLKWEDTIYEIRKNMLPTKIIITSLKDIPFWKYRDNVIEISKSMKNIKYPNDITYKLSEYPLIQFSKFSWIKDAMNHFDSHTYIWIDAGYSKFFYDKKNILTLNQSIFQNKCLFEINRDNLLASITFDNYIGTCECIFRGSMFSIPKNIFETFYKKIMYIWEIEMLSKNRYDNEQIAVALLYKEMPELFSLIKSTDKHCFAITNTFFN